MAPMRTYAVLGVAVALLLLGIVLLRNAFVGSVQTFTPGGLTRDPVVTQVQRTTRPNSGGSVDSGWVYLDRTLDRIDSVGVSTGATLQMFIVAPESSFVRNGRSDCHIMRVSIARQQNYIDGFAVVLNGSTHTLTRAPTTWLGRLLSPDRKGTEPVGRRMWSNRWFPVADLARVEPEDLMPSAPVGTVHLRKDERYIVRKQGLPYKMGNREVVSWSADEPGSVLVTSMDDAEPVQSPTRSRK